MLSLLFVCRAAHEQRKGAPRHGCLLYFAEYISPQPLTCSTPTSLIGASPYLKMHCHHHSSVGQVMGCWRGSPGMDAYCILMKRYLHNHIERWSRVNAKLDRSVEYKMVYYFSCPICIFIMFIVLPDVLNFLNNPSTYWWEKTCLPFLVMFLERFCQTCQ